MHTLPRSTTRSPSPWRFLLYAVILALECAPLYASVLPAPAVLVCTQPDNAHLWAGAPCQHRAFVGPTSAYLVGSVSKTAPVWAHTLTGYTDPHTLIVACPKGATVSPDGTQCTDAQGVDLSALVAISALPQFAYTPPAPPPVLNTNYVITSTTTEGIVIVLTSLQAQQPQCLTFSAGTHSQSVCLPPNP